MIYRTTTTVSDAVWVGRHLRDEDKQELLTIDPDRPPVEAVVNSFLSSAECFTLRSSELPSPIGLFGCLPDPVHQGFGVVWFLGTPEIRGKGLRILRVCKPWLDEWCRDFPNGIHNIADSRNDLHIRWCQLAGFTVRRDILDLRGTAFTYIHRTAEDASLV